MSKKKNKDWLKLKRYTHFTPSYEGKHIPFIKRYVSTPKNVEKHRFFPLIHYSIVEKRFRREYFFQDSENGQSIRFRNFKRTFNGSKKREIFYANHLDAHIFSYYSHLLNQKLEEEYTKSTELSNAVIAYRAIEKDENRNKCNIDFAHEVFSYIRNSKEKKLCAICLDIKNFFPSMDQQILKKKWSNLLKKSSLPLDHFKVYKAVTKYSFVELSDLINEFSEYKIKSISYLKEKNIDSFCKSGKEFRKRVVKKGLVRTCNNCGKGIAQGTPISATLSNLYMLDFDKYVLNYLSDYSSLYRRYSDDLVIIVDINRVDEVMRCVKNYIQESLNLIIKEEKTQLVYFDKTNVKVKCYSQEKGVKIKNKPLSYLGFEFDGNRILLRQKGLSGYYRKVKRIIKRGAAFAKIAKSFNERHEGRYKERDGWIYRKKIYQSKTHLGAKKKKINGKVYWGNYISYALNASKIMNDSRIKKQISKHWRIIEDLIKKLEKQYNLDKTPSRRNNS